jgi:hypothetical protein
MFRIVMIGKRALPGFVWVQRAPILAVWRENAGAFSALIELLGATTLSRCKIELSMRDFWGSKIRGE